MSRNLPDVCNGCFDKTICEKLSPGFPLSNIECDRLSKETIKNIEEIESVKDNNDTFEVMKYKEKQCGLFSYRSWEVVESFKDIKSAKSYIKNEILEGDSPADYKIVKSIEFNISID